MTKQVQEDSAAAATLHPQNKSQMLAAALAKMAGLGIEDLSHFLNDTLAQVGHEADAIPGGASNSNQASVNMKPSAAVKEDLAVIFGEGEELSEDLREKTATLFEAAVETRVILERETLIEEMNQKLDEAFDAIQEEMAEKLDVYLDTVIETWLKENEVAVESALRNELMENFVHGLKDLFAEHYMNVPEDKVNVVEQLAETVSQLETRLDATLTENAKLKGVILEAEKYNAIDDVCEGLALTQAEKIRTLCESVEFDGDIETFGKKVQLVKEGVVGKSDKETPSTGILTEESDPDAAARGNAPTAGSSLTPEVQRYKDAISRSVRK